GLAGLHGDEGAAAALRQLALKGFVAEKVVMEDARAAGLGHELGPEADEAAGGHEELEAQVGAAAVEGGAGDHVLHLALALAEVLDHGAGVLLRYVDDHVLDRLGEDVGDALEDDLGTRD